MPASPSTPARLARFALQRGGWAILSRDGYRAVFALLALRLEPGAPRSGFVVVPDEKLAEYGLNPLSLQRALAEARAAGLIEIEFEQAERPVVPDVKRRRDVSRERLFTS